MSAVLGRATDQSVSHSVPATAAGPQQPAQAQPTATELGPERIRLVTGDSLLLETSSQVKRVLTGNSKVIETVMTSPTELVITGKETGASSLMLWEVTGRHRTLAVSVSLDVAPLRRALQHSFPESAIEVEAEADKLILGGTVPSNAVAEQMVKMASSYSKEVVNGLQIAVAAHQQQILLKVRFAEADRSRLAAFGVNLFSTGAANTIGSTSTQQFGPLASQSQNSSTGVSTQFSLSDLLNIFLFRPDINLGATIKDLQQKQVMQILAEPNLMAINGQPARFLAGGEFPYPVVQGTGGGGALGAITIQFKPYGVKLEFVGTIAPDHSIRLKVIPEVSSLDYTNSLTIQGFTMPALQTRRAETEIELKDGQTFGIAGLLDQRTTVQLSKVPGIADVPVLGELFKSRNVNRTNTELIVLVTPTIVDPVMGLAPPAEPQVDMPVKNLDTGTFDRGLPSPSNPPDRR
jgi:pilus assembly protein CpaC